MEHRFVRLERRDQVATVILDRAPDNRLDIDMIEELNALMLSLRGDASLEVLVMRGRADVFSRGLDARERKPSSVQRFLQVYSRFFETLRMMEVISVAAVEGDAVAEGFELALGFNLMVASRSARFSLTQTRHGVIPPFACIILPRVVPRRRAMEWILTGNDIPAEELHQFGLVNRLFEPGEFEAGLDAFLSEITAQSGPVLQIARRAQFAAYYSSFGHALEEVRKLYLGDLMHTEDMFEGLRALEEGRKPMWQNR